MDDHLGIDVHKRESRNVAWLLSQSRRVDGAPTPRIPACADELTGLVLDERE